MIDDLHDFAWRAIHTFWQSFATAFVIPDQLWDFGAWEAALFAAVAAGLSAVKGLVSDTLRRRTT